MTKPHNIASFVLRFTQELWQDIQGEPHIRWRGHIRHVQSDEENRFTDFAEAVTFIQRYLTELTLAALSDKNMSQPKVFRESFKLWEQFAASYTDIMVKAMERTLEQSETFNKQMSEATEKTFNTWPIPMPSDQEQAGQKKVLEALSDLQAHIKTLTDRVEALEKSVKG